MKYDFSTLMDRRGTNSLKWNVEEHELPMWVADMDFQTAPEILEALQKRLNHGIFGYNIIPDQWYEAVISWWKTRHDFEIEKEWLVFCTGVIPAISSVVRKMTSVAENVVILTPVYNHFFISIEDNGRNVVESRLKYNGSCYEIDYEDLETKLSDPQSTLMILSNPHNPTGNIWDRETLVKIGALCEKHHVLVVSDEIHCDLTDPGYEYVPFASASQVCARNSVSCIAPTKAFNIAGLNTAAVIVPDDNLRARVRRGLETDDAAQPGTFAIEAAVAAFTKGGPWLDTLRVEIEANKKIVSEFITANIPEVKVVSSHATYLMWLDFGQITKNSSELCAWIRQVTGLYMNIGKIYGGNGGEFARLNVACQKERLMDGLQRLAEGIASYREQKGY